MTWSKVSTSSVQLVPAEASIASRKYYEQFEEILGWFTNRGWTITPKSTNASGGLDNWWSLEKAMTSYEGVLFTYRWIYHLKQTQHHPALTAISGSFGLESMNETQAGIYSYPSTFFPRHTDTGIECWQSDEDSDSMLLVASKSNGYKYVIGFMPGTESIRVSTFQNQGTMGNTFLSILPFADEVMLGNGTNFIQTSFGEMAHVPTSTYAPTLPVLTKGEVDIHDRSTPFARWRQSDIATYENFLLDDGPWANHEVWHLGTVLIDGDYYIRLGEVGDCATALLNCGTANPGINL